MSEQEFLTSATGAAKAAGHLFPEMAACEAAYSSKFGQTQSALKANNLFDFRVPAKLFAGALTVSIATVQGKYNSRLAFASWEDCFRYRAQWMERVTMFYLVRRAKTADEYLAQMARLSSDPEYAQKVRAIYTANEVSLT